MKLEPAPGVKISRIVSLSDDIALKVGSAEHPDRSADSLVNPSSALKFPTRKSLASPCVKCLESPEYQSSTSLLTVALGKDIGGQAIMADLAKMPHLLVAGATGSGKSICINILISSISVSGPPR
jgi:DNA segregation ATPase FtsK/SpoIIIE, S-DNA-T family